MIDCFEVVQHDCILFLSNNVDCTSFYVVIMSNLDMFLLCSCVVQYLGYYRRYLIIVITILLITCACSGIKQLVHLRLCMLQSLD